MDYLLSNGIKMDKFSNTLVISPKEGSKKNIIFYHGWSSCKENQVFRANLYATYGYRVFLPDAIYHGERGNLDYEDEKITREYILRCIKKNLEESEKLIDYVSEFGTVLTSGHSMGAITAGGVFANDKRISAAIVFNGMMDYEMLISEVDSNKEKFGLTPDKEVNEYLLKIDPLKNLENLNKRPLALLNGDEDEIIDPKGNENFYNQAKKYYGDSDLIFERFDLTRHQITTDMIEKSLIFLKENLK